MEKDNENTMTFEQLGELAGLSFTSEENTVEVPESFNEETTVEEVEEKKEEEVTTEELETFEESEAYRVSQFLINSGQLEDLEVEIDGDTFKLSEAKNLDQETLTEIIKTYNSEKEKGLTEGKVDVTDLDSVQQKLINIIKDGDYSRAKELFQNPEQLVEPFRGYDPTNEQHNEEVYLKDLIARNPNMTQKKAFALLDIEKSEGTLDETAQGIVNQYREKFIKGLEQLEEQTRAEKEEQVKKEKQYIKDINNIYKGMEVKDSIALQMSKLAQKDKEGKRAIDSIIEETLSDPNKASELIMFLSNKDLYDKRVGSKVKNETEIGFAKKINIVRSKPKVNNEEKPDNFPNTFKETFGNIKLK